MSVSLLIPAFRPTYLRQAIASALTQEAQDLEIIVSDDSGGEDLLPIVETFRDPRIRYIRTPGRIGAGENCRALWAEARHDRTIFLFDDDLLMPHALVELGAALDANPGASFAFGRRNVIDQSGRILQEPRPVAPIAVLSGEEIAAALLKAVSNPIGEMSNVLINRAVGLTADDLLAYFGVDLHVVADVAFYLNATRTGPAVGVGKTVGAFRRHDAQNSSAAFNPKLAIGVVEWELFFRGEHDAGRLPRENALIGLETLRGHYVRWSAKHPAIARMTPGLDRLRQRIEAGETGVLDAAFRAEWEGFVTAVIDGTR